MMVMFLILVLLNLSKTLCFAITEVLNTFSKFSKMDYPD